MTGLIPLDVERPVAGGRMLARYEGRVVLVSGTLPGERVLARVERVSRKVVLASAVEVLEPSVDRRRPPFDVACGGLGYAHIAPARQRALKADVVRDAFLRIGRLPIEGHIGVAASPEQGYRLRGRLHVKNGRVGLYVERTHDLCDPAGTGQFRPDTLDAVGRVVRSLGHAIDDVDSLVIGENVGATERVVHLEAVHGAELRVEQAADLVDGATGLTARVRDRLVCLAGNGRVVDSTRDLCGETDALPDGITWARSAASFFQANRYLTGTMLLRVLAAVRGSRVLDLYAGVGLFSLGAAVRGATVTAVEAEPASVADLEVNAEPFPALTPRQATVEAALLTVPPGAFDTIILDPPRTGASVEAVSGIVAARAARVVYVSCDAATLARDSARLVAGGYALTSVEAFDLFPNTPHVETLAVFDRAPST